jgi:hypothetical protein
MAGMTVKAILTDPKVRVIPQSHESFMRGLKFLSGARRQELQPDRLHFDADNGVRSFLASRSRALCACHADAHAAGLFAKFLDLLVTFQTVFSNSYGV